MKSWVYSIIFICWTCLLENVPDAEALALMLHLCEIWSMYVVY